MLNEERLTLAIKLVLDADSPSNQENPDDDAELVASRLKMANGIARAVINEIKMANVDYVGGLASPSGPVTGKINHTIS
jgi:hypothetical protein